jgi:Alpha-L-fucosidase
LQHTSYSAMNISRRNYLKTFLVGAAASALARCPTFGEIAPSMVDSPDHERRIQWWREAKFGMFIHWGLYSILGREAWAMGDEDIPLPEYEALSKQFRPPEGAPRAWARLARESGMRYLVLTTKHHEGFCLFASQLTDYCATRAAILSENMLKPPARKNWASVFIIPSWIGIIRIGLGQETIPPPGRVLWTTPTGRSAS